MEEKTITPPKEQKKKGEIMQKIRELEKKLEEKDKEIQDYVNTLKRIQADFENYIKRTEKEKLQTQLIIKRNLFLELLSVVDSFEAAINSLKNVENKEILNGIKGIYNNLITFLENHGVKEIGAIGQKSDPFKHEIVKQQESDQEEDTILGEIQKGYLFDGSVLRPSKVIISDSKKEKSNNTGENKEQ